MRTQRWRLTVVILYLLVFVGSGSALAQGADSPLNYRGADRSQRLLEGARREGRVTWYTSLAGPVVQRLARAFQDEFGVQVDVYRASTNNVVTRIAQEGMARRYTVDIVEATFPAALSLEDLGLLQPYYSPALEAIPDDFVFRAPGGLAWAANDRISYIGFGYNTRLLSSEAVPNTFEDLLRPALTGKMGIVDSDTGVRWVGLVLHAMGEPQGRAFLNRLSSQNVRVESISGAAMMDLIAQGQLAAGLATFEDHAHQQQQRGAPAAWKPVHTAIANLGMVMIGRNAPHPHAAMLFGEWLFAGNGRKILVEQSGYGHWSIDPGYPAWVPEAGLSAKRYEDAYNLWSRLFDQTFRR